MITKQKEIEELIDKAAKADHADEAMKFAQAALNAANAVIGLSNVKTK